MFFLFLLLFSLSVFGITPTINDFNINNDENYTTNKIVTLNISAVNATEMQFSCSNESWPADWLTYSSSSSFDLTTGNACNSSEGTKIVYAKVKSSDGNIADANDSIIFDMTAPITTTDLNSSAGYKNDITINFSCSDAISDCNITAYRIDSDATDNINFGSWLIGTSFNTNVFSEDGNYAIDFNSTDKAGNIESTKTTYFLRDFSNKPEIEFISPTNNSTITNNIISFKVKDAVSGVKISSIKIDVNGLHSDFNANSCTLIGDGNYSCSYTEKLLIKSNDYNLAISLEDLAGNTNYAEIHFTYNDITAPTKPNTPVLVSASSNTIKIGWQPNTELDVNYYEVYRSTRNFDANNENLIGKTLNANCSASCYFEDSNSLSIDLNYYYRIKAIDFSNNKSVQSEQAGPFSLNQGILSTPTISSSHQNNVWSNSNDVNFSWNSVSNATGYSYLFNETSDSVPDTSIDTTNTSILFNDVSDGIHYFHLRACNSINCSETAHFKVKIDTIAPQKVSGINISLLFDGSIKLTWNSSTDDGSGIKDYVIYRGTNTDFSLDSIYASTSDTTYTDTEVTEGITYYYVLKARDNANNYSEASSEYYKKSIKSSDFNLELIALDYIKSGTTLIEVKANHSFSEGSLKVLKPNASAFELLVSGKQGTTFTYNYAFTEIGSYEFIASVTYNDINFTKSKKIIFDNVKPIISWVNPKENDIIGNKIELKVKASDDFGLKKVSFYLGSKLLKEIIENKEYYSFYWDSNEIDDGKYSLKAIAEDNAANINESSINVFIVQGNSKAEQEAKAELIKAKIEEEALNLILESFKSREVIISKELTEKITQANNLINEGKTFLQEKNFIKAKETFNKAKQLFLEVKESLSIQVIASEEYSFNEEDFNAVINEFIKNDELKKEALNNSKFIESKSIEVLEFSDSIKKEKRVQVTIKLKNESKNAKILKVIEFIPATLANSIDFYSANNYLILNEKPLIVQFNLSIAPESTSIIRFSLKKDFSSYEKQELINSLRSTLGKTPLVFLKSTELTQKDFNLKELLTPVEGTFILAIFGLIVLSIIAFIAYYYSMHLKKPKTISTRNKWMHPEEKKKLK